MDLVALTKAPKLETLLLDSRLDHIAGEVVGSVLAGRNGADRTLGAELLRQLAASQIASKCTEVRICLRLEYEYPHDLASAWCDIVVVIGSPLSIVDHRRQKWLRCAGRPPDPARITRLPARVLVLSLSSARPYRPRPCVLSAYSPMLIEVDCLSVIVHCAALEDSPCFCTSG